MKPTIRSDESEAEIVQQITEQAEQRSQDHDRLVNLVADLDIQADWFTDEDDNETTLYRLDSMVLVYLYKFARGMSSTDVVDFLATTGKESQFGLPTVPTQQTVHYAWRNRFDSTDRSVIRKAALGVRFAHEFH